MKEITFKKEGKLMASISHIGLMEAAYTLILTEKNSNQPVLIKPGNNLNPEDDYFLSTPAESNDGRLLSLSTTFKAVNGKNGTPYKIELSVYQGDDLLGTESEEGTLNNNTNSSMLFVKLVMDLRT